MLPLALLLAFPLGSFAATPSPAAGTPLCGYTLHYSITRYEQSVLFEAPDRPALWVTDLELRIDGRSAVLPQEQRPALPQLRAAAGALTETLDRTHREAVELAGWQTLAALTAAGHASGLATLPPAAASTEPALGGGRAGASIDEDIALIVAAVLDGGVPGAGATPADLGLHLTQLRRQLDADQALSCSQLDTLNQLQSRLPGLRLLSAS
jgi:hypothetical protein